MVVNSIVQGMIELGFSEYEARAYIGALQEGQATAYQIAKSAGMPTSKIYGIIARLVDKGILLPVGGTERTEYAPCPPSEFIEGRRDRLHKTLDDLREALISLGGPRETSLVWNLSEYRAVIERAVRIISGSRTRLLVSAWPEEGASLAEDLGAAIRRGVDTALVHFGRPEAGTATWYGRDLETLTKEAGCGRVSVFPHPIADTLYEERGGRGFTLVADSSEAMMATMFTGGRAEGAYSANRGFVLLAEDYVKHDIYIMKIVGRYDRELLRRFGEGYGLLRDVFSDGEIQEENNR